MLFYQLNIKITRNLQYIKILIVEIQLKIFHNFKVDLLLGFKYYFIKILIFVNDIIDP